MEAWLDTRAIVTAVIHRVPSGSSVGFTAHGEWDQVKDHDRIQLMLEGVNLFFRKHAT
jgi:hypothetical protein